MIHNHDLEEAKSLLKHYLSVLAEHAGMPWNSDSDIEVERICDKLIAAALMEFQVQRNS